MRLHVSARLRTHPLLPRRVNVWHRARGAPGHRARVAPGGRAPGAGGAGEFAQYAELTEFIYELLDAHHDTAQMAAEEALEEPWGAHLDYLRALQREGRAMLARMPVEDTRPDSLGPLA